MNLYFLKEINYLKHVICGAAYLNLFSKKTKFNCTNMLSSCNFI